LAPLLAAFDPGARAPRDFGVQPMEQVSANSPRTTELREKIFVMSGFPAARAFRPGQA
jgi:hypothetical protein